MNETEWEKSLDPAAMLRHLAKRGCTGDFALFEDEVFKRIRKEVSEPTLVDFIENGQTPELHTVAEERMAELCSELASLDVNYKLFPTKSRQLEIGNAILVFRGQGYAETLIDLAEGVASLFDDSLREVAWQASRIRALHDFNYTP